MIGTTLRAAREARHLSVRDINVATNMMVKQIEQIEENNFDSFSAPVYAKGFIKLYARAVGIDAKPLIDEYNRMVKAGDKKPQQPSDLSFLRATIEAEAPAAAPAPAASEEAAASAPAPAAQAEEPEKPREPDLFDRLDKPAAPAPQAEPAPSQAAPAPAPPVLTEESELVAKVVAAPSAPEPAAAAPAPGVLPEVRHTAPQPVKRVAPVHPGFQPSAPEVPATRLATATDKGEFTPPPAAKKVAPEPESPIFHAMPHSGHAVAPGVLPRPVSTTSAPLTLGIPASAYKPASAPSPLPEAAPFPGEASAPADLPAVAPEASVAPAPEAASAEASPHYPVKRPAPESAPTVPVTDPDQPSLFSVLFTTFRGSVVRSLNEFKKSILARAERRAAAKAKADLLRSDPDALVDAPVQTPKLRLSKRGKVVIGIAAIAVFLLIVVLPVSLLFSGKRAPVEDPALLEPALAIEEAGLPAPVQAPTTIAPIFEAPYSFAN